MYGPRPIIMSNLAATYLKLEQCGHKSSAHVDSDVHFFAGMNLRNGPPIVPYFIRQPWLKHVFGEPWPGKA